MVFLKNEIEVNDNQLNALLQPNSNNSSSEFMEIDLFKLVNKFAIRDLDYYIKSDYESDDENKEKDKNDKKDIELEEEIKVNLNTLNYILIKN